MDIAHVDMHQGVILPDNS